MKQSDIEHIINSSADDIVAVIMMRVDKAISYAIEELYNEAWHMYESFIQQYYKYETTSYIRHGEEKVGTGVGINLYRALDFSYSVSKKNRYIDFNLRPEDMEYEKYKIGTRSDVLDNVLYGHRGIPGVWNIDWEGKFKGKYFQYEGIMKDAFHVFIHYIVDIAEPIVINYLDKEGWLDGGKG